MFGKYEVFVSNYIKNTIFAFDQSRVYAKLFFNSCRQTGGLW
jgi:hypothetical protein